MGADYAGDKDKNTARVLGSNAKDIFLVLDPHSIGRIGGNDTWEIVDDKGHLINKEGGVRLHQIRDYAESLGDSVVKRGRDAWAWMEKHAGEAAAKAPTLR